MTAGAPHRLSAENLARGLDTTRVGRQVYVFDDLPSTNTYVLDELAVADQPPDGAAVFAEHQSAGRGRLGRTWQVPRGAGLLVTVLLIESADGRQGEARRQSLITRTMLASSVAVVEAICTTTDVDAMLRWPNDVYARGRKLGGILIETRSIAPDRTAVAIGIGLNCLQHAAHFPLEIRDRATSLEIESAAPIDRLAVARALLLQLDARLAVPMSDARLAGDWRAYSADIGTHATLIENGMRFSGRVLDVDPAEGLLVQLDTGARRHFDPATTSRVLA